MSKHIYRIIIIFFLNSICFAVDSSEVNSIVQNLVSQYKGLEHDEAFKEEIKKRYQYLLKTADTNTSVQALKKIEQSAAPSLQENKIFNIGTKFVQSANPTAAKELEEVKKNAKSMASRNTIFYFYSESMPKVAFERFFITLKTLQAEFGNELKGYVVFRGFPEDFKNFASRYDRKAISGGKAKFHPLMYRYYDLKAVPAYAFAQCPESFNFKKCTNHLLVKGDLSLAGALKIFSEENKNLQKYYDYLTEAK